MEKFHDFLRDKELDKYSWITFDVDEYVINILIEESAEILLEKYSKGSPLIGVYSFKQHSPHASKGQYHLHVYAKNNEIFALNIDGTAHDKSHGVVIPQKVADAIRVKFPKYKIPNNNLIESADKKVEALYLTYIVESTGFNNQLKSVKRK